MSDRGQTDVERRRDESWTDVEQNDRTLIWQNVRTERRHHNRTQHDSTSKRRLAIC
jgi:hypothetical protein